MVDKTEVSLLPLVEVRADGCIVVGAGESGMNKWPNRRMMGSSRVANCLVSFMSDSFSSPYT